MSEANDNSNEFRIGNYVFSLGSTSNDELETSEKSNQNTDTTTGDTENLPTAELVDNTIQAVDVIPITRNNCSENTWFVSKDRINMFIEIRRAQLNGFSIADVILNPDTATVREIANFTPDCYLCQQPLLGRYPLGYLRMNPRQRCLPANDMMEDGWQHWRSNAIFQVGCSHQHRFHYGCLHNYLTRSGIARINSEDYSCPGCHQPCLGRNDYMIIEYFIGNEEPISSLGDSWPRSNLGDEFDANNLNQNWDYVDASHYYGNGNGTNADYLGDGKPGEEQEGENQESCCTVSGGKKKKTKKKGKRKNKKKTKRKN